MWSSSPYDPMDGGGGTPIRPPAAGKTMEDVWREISTLPHPHHPSAARGAILQDFFSSDPDPASPTPPPTVLTLNSAAAHHLRSLVLLQQPVHPHHAPCSSLKKRLPEEFSVSSGGGDRRHKRMIKNRDSAARSRARKQAYTNELESEVAHLLEENAKLKEQHNQLQRAAAAQHPKGKHPHHHRTFSAPF